jgi:FkbM family methyltransferase
VLLCCVAVSDRLSWLVSARATSLPVRLRRLMRPTKLRAALGRRWFEASLRRLRIDSYGERLQRLGSEYGGWIVPVDLIDETWTCYCVGAGSDVTFDLALLRNYGARVRTFDPFHVFGEQARQAAGGDPRFSFHEVAIAPSDGPVVMYGRQDEESGSLSAANLYGVGSSFVKPGRSLPSLVAELGDETVELLKLDVEGSEYAVLSALDPLALGVRVLCVELHHTVAPRVAKHHVERLRSLGYDLVYLGDPAELTLVRRA